MKISLIGIGRMGGALALALSRKNYKVEDLVARNPSNAEKIAAEIHPSPQILSFDEAGKLSDSEIIFITTQDGEIETVARKLAVKLNSKPFIFHTSGSLSSEVLRDLQKKGCRTGSLHPLLSVSDALTGSRRFRDIFFCVEGDAESVVLAEKIVADLEGKSFSIAAKFKPLYHASAVTSAGHITALFSVAVEMLSACGLNADAAQKILLPLAKSTIENLESQTPAEALTGTFARADTKTLEKHLALLEENVSAEALKVYLQLGLRSLHLAEMQGVNREKLAKMREILQTAGK